MGENLDFSTVELVQSAGFEGFIPIGDLHRSRCREIPKAGGVYIIVRIPDDAPVILAESKAGADKGTDLTVSQQFLKGNWIEGTPVLYIGKAGGPKIKQGLRDGLRKLIDNGFAEKAKRKGGKLLWQLGDAESLLVCWTAGSEDYTPLEMENNLKSIFKNQFGSLPFANLV